MAKKNEPKVPKSILGFKLSKGTRKDLKKLLKMFRNPDTHTLAMTAAGGLAALTTSQEGAEDDGPMGVKEIRGKKVSKKDVVIGLSVSGRAAYVREALNEARTRGAFTACITCNANSLLIPCADVSIVVETGPEVVAGSTRMKAGTAQKMVLNRPRRRRSSSWDGPSASPEDSI